MSESLTASPPPVYILNHVQLACPLADTFSVGPLSPGIIWYIHTPDFKSNTPKDDCDVVEYDNIYF